MQLIHGKKKKKWLGYFLDIIKEDICEFESEKKQWEVKCLSLSND